MKLGKGGVPGHGSSQPGQVGWDGAFGRRHQSHSLGSFCLPTLFPSCPLHRACSHTQVRWVGSRLVNGAQALLAAAPAPAKCRSPACETVVNAPGSAQLDTGCPAPKQSHPQTHTAEVPPLQVNFAHFRGAKRAKLEAFTELGTSSEGALLRVRAAGDPVAQEHHFLLSDAACPLSHCTMDRDNLAHHALIRPQFQTGL